MKISELIIQATELLAYHGDNEVVVSLLSCSGNVEIKIEDLSMYTSNIVNVNCDIDNNIIKKINAIKE